MPRENLHDLIAFVAVARERSFTRAAAQLGISQSTLSHKIRGLEERLGLRLLTRTTRSVSPTDAGERLLQNLAPHFDEIDGQLAELGDLRDKPAGTIRITATDYAINTIVWPKLAKLLPEYPDIKVEISLDYALRDIVADRFDIDPPGVSTPCAVPGKPNNSKWAFLYASVAGAALYLGRTLRFSR